MYYQIHTEYKILLSNTIQNTKFYYQIQFRIQNVLSNTYRIQNFTSKYNSE